MSSSDKALFGLDLFGESMEPAATGAVAAKFGFPPFTILDAKQGEWQDRKRAWASLGIRGEIGRGDVLCFREAISDTDLVGQAMNAAGGGTSIFDPVLCEMAYRWFCPAGGQVLDPFAGGSVRGIVAGILGRRYWGCDLRAEQVAANREQATEIRPAVAPAWHCGDSATTLAAAPLADFVFSCPPYGDLEKYSDDPADLSAMKWDDFALAYRRIIAASVARMKPDTFACFVVGDFRGKDGYYRNFPGVTVAAFEAAGARLYNEAILATPIGTACLRVTKQFNSGRKLAKTHQNILVFCNGNWKRAADKCQVAP